MSAAKRRNRGSAYARRDTTQDEEAVSGRRSIAPRNAAKAPGAATAFRVGSEEERESLPSTRGAKRGQNRGRQPSGPKQVEASCAGLRTEDVYAYVERAHGRANRPTCNGSTVAPNSDRTLCWRTGTVPCRFIHLIYPTTSEMR